MGSHVALLKRLAAIPNGAQEVRPNLILAVVCSTMFLDPPSFTALVIARAFQGIGAGFTIPSAQAHVAIYFPSPAERAKALGFWAAAGSMGFIVGLILVVPAAHVILPRAITAHSPASREITDQEREENKLFYSIKTRLIRFDVLGICLGVPSLLLLTYALTSANTAGWSSPSIVSTLVISSVLLLVFALHEYRAPQALINPRLFSPSFTLTLVLAVATYAVRQACSYFLTLQLQSYGSSPLHTALLFLPVGISALITNTAAGRLVPLLGARAMFVLGWGLCIPGVVLFSFITQETSYWRFTFPGMILYIAGLGVVYITANFVVVSNANKSDQGVVAGVFNVALQVGGSVLGLAVLTSVANGINGRYSSGNAEGKLSLIGYQSVYYSCIILCAVALALSLVVKIPDAMKGSLWKNPEQEARAEQQAQAQTAMEMN
ncbi:drug resistance transporter EmrB/QacA [Microsporum canis CBS 113480]|uniref:Drug resistance transporter EmrB/QacA n=1 Tax=Arthroderma otae (strain ATCC MYA-4605 / CBS 113480) TaxID=554155 RepID=C5FNT7_ARTOC|nr:drug resistance transporter EmrB/QacA [Microsporum canis CBS 113480]EEQ31790.1 drug resistance transporter EmrB/QacA [Microsporum canis CBS 113480]